MKIYDISHPLATGIGAWPGDTPYTVTWNLRLDDGAAVNLSDVRLSVHTGTHADAPLHFDPVGSGIDGVDLACYLGPARVVTARPGSEVRSEDLRRSDWPFTPRCLIRTGSCPDPNTFNRELMAISLEAARYLVEQGVRLVGTDAPSVDPFESKELPVHHVLGKHRVAILENLALNGVPDGVYELIALPLRLAGLDASPVRALLRVPEPPQT